MDYRDRFIQAYKNTPWRKQLQVIGLFSVSITFIAIIAGVYLNVSARAATIGREIQEMRATMTVIEREIQDHESQLAYQTSAKVMAQRAEDSGYQLIAPNQVIYIQVTGYTGEQNAQLASTQQSHASAFHTLPRAHTVSLIEWIRETIYIIGQQTGAQAIQGGSP